MKWWDILKNTKLSGRAKGKGTSFDASKIKINIDEGDKCNKQLQEWANKLKNYDLLMKKRFEESELLQKHFEIEIDETKPVFKKFFLNQKGKNVYSEYQLYEITYFLYEPVPEKVACKAIDMIKKSTTSSPTINSPVDSENFKIEIKDDKYEIIIENKHTYQVNITKIMIIENGNLKVSIGWVNGEEVSYGEDEFRRELKGNQEDNNVYHLSGYYEAQGFGYSWWK